jgi:hypothetical protein
MNSRNEHVRMCSLVACARRDDWRRDTCLSRVRFGVDAIASHVEKSRFCVNLNSFIDTVMIQDVLYA